MAQDRAFCGIDVGTQGVRAVILDATGRELGAGQRGLQDSLRKGDRHEQDPATWWDALIGSVADAVADADHPHVESLCLDATSGTVVVQDTNGSSVGPALMYDDARAAAQAKRAVTEGARLWSELGYRVQASWALPKVMWLLENGHLAHGRRLAHQADHLVGRLVGGVAPADVSHALKTGADPRTVAWPADVLEALGVPIGVLPELVLPGSPVGAITDDAAAATGLTPGCRVRAGMTDGCAAQISARALRWGSWSSTLGTTLVVKGATRDLVNDPTGAVYCHRHPDGGWLPGGASSSGAGYFRDRLAGRDLAALTRQVAGRSLGDRVVFPLAGRGERFPFVATDATSFTTPPTPEPDDAELFAAASLGLAYVERLAYDVLGRLGADVTGSVSLSGGASRNRWLNQLRTDVLGRTTVLLASTGAASGMAVLAASEPGHESRGVTATAERMVRPVEELHPDVGRGQALGRGYVDFVGELATRGWLAPDVADAATTAAGAGL